MKKKGNFSVLMSYAGRHRALTYMSLVLAAASAALALMPFVYIWLIVDEVLSVAPDFSAARSLAAYGWCAVGFALGSMAVYFGALMCSHLSAFRIASNIKRRALYHVAALPVGEAERVGSGKLRSIINTCASSTETYLAHNLPDMAAAMTTPVEITALLFVFDWRLGLLSLVPTAISFAIMSAMTGRRMAEKMREYNNALSDMNNQAVEYVRGIPVVKTFSQTIYSFKRFKGTIDDYSRWTIAYTKSLRAPMVAFTTVINAVFALLIAAALVITSGGVETAFLTDLLFYIIFTPIISVTLLRIMFMSENGLIVGDALDRIDSVFALRPLSKGENRLIPDGSSVEFKEVCFKYADSDRYAVKDLSFKIEQGERVALVGGSGGGKTTAAALISRFFDVESGEVLVGGVNVKDIEKEELANRIAYVFQDSRLLKTTVLENVRLARPYATRQEALAALKAAQCDDIIAKLPNGIDTVIGADGVYLSGGEQQRIAIARLILKDAPIVVLDEATAYADPENERRVQAALAELSEGKTVITIAHRLASVEGCDRIIVLKEGRAVESGAHAYLLSLHGEYGRMYNEYRSSIEWRITTAAEEL